MIQDCFPTLSSTPHLGGQSERSLNTPFEGQRAVVDEQMDGWMSFLRGWVEHYQPL